MYGFKAINYPPYPTLFFSKTNFFEQKNHQKKLDFYSFQNQLKYYQNDESCSIFSHVTFSF